MPHTKKPGTERVDVHASITEKLIAAIEAGPGDFRMPWHRSAGSIMRPTNIATKKSYQGINVLALWAAGDAKGYQSGVWGTYKQWGEAGAQVCKGQKSSMVVFWKTFEAKDGNGGLAEPAGEGDKTGTRMFARASSVFAAEQVEGYEPPTTPDAVRFDPIEAAEAYVSATEARVSHGGDRAFYNRVRDTITMPRRAAFTGSPTSTPQETYYSTLLHELVHFSGHESRTHREFGKRFGDDAYAMEELTAEIGAAFLCSQLGVSLDPRTDHAQYLNGWLKVLKADNKAIFTAASKASQAVRYLDELQRRPVAPEL